MKPENRINLIKELENIKRINSRNRYSGAGSLLIILGGVLANLINNPSGMISMLESSWITILYSVIVLVVVFQSFFLIIHHLIYKRLLIIFEALLDDK